MTQAEVETELAFLRDQVIRLQQQESQRSKAWKSTLRIVRFFVIAFSVAAAVLLVQSGITGEKTNLQWALQLLLLNTPLIFLGQALRLGSESIDAKGL